MKTARRNKLIIMLTALIMLLFSIALTMPLNNGAKAISTSASPSNFFDGVSDIKLENDKVSATVSSGDTLSFKNSLVVNDLELKLSVDSGISKFSIKLESDSYFVNGVGEDLDKKITNTLLFDNGTVKLNDLESKSYTVSGDLTVKFSVDNNVLKVSVGEGTAVDFVNTDEKYKIAGMDKCVADVSFEFTEVTESKKFEIISVHQNVSEGDAYKQTFVLTDSKLSYALPVVKLADKFYNADGELKFKKGTQYSLSFTSYSVLGSTSTIYIDKNGEENVWVSNSTTPLDIVVYKTGDVEIKVKTNESSLKDGDTDATLATYTVSVYEKTDDITAPEFTYDEKALSSFKNALEKATVKDDHSVSLGTSITIPSFKGLVKDDFDAYENLTYKLYYKTPSSDTYTSVSAGSSASITLTDAGTYVFYPVFKDSNGNEMDKDLIFDEDNDEIKDEKSVFTFTVKDDAPFELTVTDNQGEGYLNTEYVASDFTIVGENNTVTYKLVYIDGENKYEIYNTAKVSEDDYSDYENTLFTYDELKQINYDGKLTFTPIRKGDYEITCTVVSSNSAKMDSKTTTIKVVDKKVVKPANHWVRDNVWSVVFLGVGSLCLIGILVLLFIKPKEEVEEEEITVAK